MDSLRLLVLLLTLVLRLPSDVTDDLLYCESWRVSVEVNSFQNWRTVPARCADFVKQYMTSERYKLDLQVAANESLAFAETVRVAGDGNDVWVFDVDETLLSNLGYYAKYEYGAKKGDSTSWATWVDSAEASALQASLNLYKYLLGRGFQIVLITGRREAKRNSTEDNLKKAGYPKCAEENLSLAGPPICAKLIMREDSDPDKGAVYKSKKRAKLVAEGYKIHGNSGDQWSDLLGMPTANRSFKLSNPMYYIGN